MEKQLAKLVNKSFSGEPEYIVIQDTTSNKMFEFSQIIEAIEPNGDISRVSLDNNNLDPPIIQRILNQSHSVDITWNENDDITLHF